jgi:EmrB/QacA subfamily drug resistance transporter
MDAPAAAKPGAGGQDPAAAPGFTHQQIMQVILGILLCILLAALDQTVVIPAVPAIAADLNGFSHLSWIVTAYLLTSTATTPIYGKLSDIYGRRALLLPAIALFMLASALCALAGSLPQLIAARVLQGVGGAGLMSMAQAAIADVVPPRERGRYQGYMASTWGVASVAGPIVGGFMTDHLSWRWVFWINLPLGLAAMWLSNNGLRVLRVVRRPARIDVPGAVLLTAGVTALLLMMSWGGTEYPWASLPEAALAACGAALLAVLAWHERRDSDPLLPPRLFANPVFTGGVTIAFFASLGLLGATFLLPLLFQLVRGADASTSGVLVIPYLVANTFGAYAGGQIARKLGRTKRIVVWGMVGTVAGFALMATVGPRTPVALVLFHMSLLGFSIGLTLPSVLVAVQNAAERRDVGVATGTLLFLRSMGGAFGSTIVGALLSLRFTGALSAAGITRHIDFGALRSGSEAFAGLGAAAEAQARAGLLSGFHLAFGTCAALTVVAVLVAAAQRDLPLRSVSAAEAGGALGH